MKKIDKLILELNRKYGEGTINRVADIKTLNIEYIPTGSYFLDLSIGKGYPKGKIIELYGIPSSGKSLLSNFTVAEVQKLGGECVWIDAEGAYDPEFAAKLGVNVDKLIVSQSSFGEPTIDLVARLLKVEPALVVIDSVAAMIPKQDLEEPMDQPVMATRARMMSRGLAKLNALNKKTIIIFINQLRTVLGGYRTTSITPGGRALGHFASVRVEVSRGEFLKDSDKKPIGQVVKFRVTKNKVGPPWKDGYFKFYYEGFIDNIDELISVALMQGKIKPSGAWYELFGKKVQGREGLDDLLSKDNKIFEKLKKLVFDET